jgi:hypothetical protein
MPCLQSEADEARAEGVEIQFLVAPLRIERNGDHRLTLTCQRMEPGEPVGLTTIGRGFEVAVAVPFAKPLAEGLQLVARRAPRISFPDRDSRGDAGVPPPAGK